MSKVRTFLSLLTAAVMIAAVCLAFTGCGQKDIPVQSQQTTEQDTAAESEKRTGSPEETVTTDAPQPETSSTEPETTEEGIRPGPDGKYTWQVGLYTLSTRINVMDYIDGTVWRVNDMAAALGWDKNSRSGVAKPMTFQMSDSYDVYINFSDAQDHCGAIIVKGDARKPVTAALPVRAAGDYTFNDKDFTMSFEGIVIFAYTCEFLSENPQGNPYEGVLGTRGSGTYVHWE